MASLSGIKKQISGIKGTRKITKAMQLVAASKARSFQNKAVTIRDFALELLYILHHNHQHLDHGPLTVEPKNAEKVLFVLYSSDKGLCGALNNHLAKKLLTSKEWNETPENLRTVMTVGKKAANFADYNGLNVVERVEGVSEKLTNFDALHHADDIVDIWEQGEYKKVYMVAPHYKNTFTAYPVVKQFLPMSSHALEAHIGVDEESFDKELPNVENDFMIFEPSNGVVTDRLINDLVHTLFMQAFYELKAAEYGSRMIAMQNATDSADKLIQEKTLVYNKARQAAITQEIAEIVGASFI